MDCPKCGYILDPFESSCPRCARLGDKAAPGAATATAPPPAKDQAVVDAISKIAPKVQGGAVPQQQVPGQPPIRRPRQEVIATGPPLGWPLTILLWIYVVLLGLYVLGFSIMMILAQSAIRDANTSSMLGGVGLIYIGGPVLMLLAVIAMLRCKLWGLWFITITTVGPLVLEMIFAGFSVLTIISLIFCAPSIAIIILGFMKYEEFD